VSAMPERIKESVCEAWVCANKVFTQIERVKVNNKLRQVFIMGWVERFFKNRQGY